MVAQKFDVDLSCFFPSVVSLSDSFEDVSVECGDKTFTANRLILCVFSDYFK